MSSVVHNRNIVIDAEFKSLIPPLTDDELARLEASLLAEGCRDALVVWAEEGVLLDGHNRYELCERYAIPYEVVYRSFATRAEATVWIIQNQLARRNLTAYARAELALRMKSAVAEQARANQSHGLTAPGKTLPQNFAEAFETNEVLGSAAGISRESIRKAEFIDTKAPDYIKVAARNGDLSIDRAYRIAKTLSEAPEPVKHVASALQIDDPHKIDHLQDLYRKGKNDHNSTFWEVYHSGVIQPGDEADAVDYARESLISIKDAIAKKERLHKMLARDERRAEAEQRFNDAPKAPQPVLYLARAEAMPIGDELIDLIITSPPYNLGSAAWPMGGGGRRKRAAGIGYEDDMDELAYQDWQVACLVEFYRVAKPGASLFYNHKVRIRNGAMIHPMDWLRDERNPWILRQEIIWDRGSTHNHSATLFWPEDERIYWLTKGAPTLPDTPIGQSTVWREFGPVPAQSWHPAPFTEKLPEMIIRAVGRPGIVVLDPFAGSGTTLRVALRLGCQAIGIDCNPDYLNNAAEVNGWTIVSAS